jgi:hypothetical protein
LTCGNALLVDWTFLWEQNRQGVLVLDADPTEVPRDPAIVRGPLG